MRVRGIVAVLTSALVLAAGPARASVPIQTVVAFDPNAGQFPEGVAVDIRGTVYVSLVGPVDDIVTVRADGSTSTFAHLSVPGFGPLGLAVDASGHLLAAVSTFDDGTRGVYRIHADGSATRLAGTGGILFPNGVALDPRGTIYATDSIGGSVWRISPGGSAQVWIHDPLLEGTGALGLGFPLGANGIAVSPHAVLVTNTEKGSVIRIPVLPDGTAGTPTVVASGSTLFGADGLTTDVFGNAYVAVNSQDMLVRVRPNGATTILATAADGLDNPASLSFGTSLGDRKSLFLTNFAVFSHKNPALLKVLLGVPGRPQP
jgi:DNA-binding beta-propeller fold protein YncE